MAPKITKAKNKEKTIYTILEGAKHFSFTQYFDPYLFFLAHTIPFSVNTFKW